IDRNQFDMHQGFLDWKWNLGESDSVTWRLGRQEFEYGTGRLIDVREGPNLRLAFDAARMLTKVGDWSLDAWWAKPVRNNLYTLENLPFQPRPGVRFDVASGDRSAASPNLQTFNPLFPSGAYFNLTGPFGPSNIIDLHPTLDLTLTDKLTFSADWNFFWRQSLEDGVYRLSGALLASGQTSRARYIGSSPA